MKYLDPKFSTPGNSRAYVDGWERVFGEEEEVEAVELPVEPEAAPAKVEAGE